VVVVGAVLAGGSGRRMGGPKGGVEVGGVPMAGRVAAALRDGGALEVLAVGGPMDLADRIGARWVADRWPGEGPLAATATALAAAGEAHGAGATAVVAPCDQPHLDAATVRSLLEALDAAADDVAVAVPVTPDGRRHPLPAAWRCRVAAEVAALVEAGERRADAGFDRLGVVTVAVAAAPLADVDTPEDLAALPAAAPESP
jgi:molybdopterin-guanine dinucleotide biosynthesis protein A